MTVYVDSNAGGANDGTSWTDAFLTFTQADAAAAANEETWIAYNHSESPGGTLSMSWASNINTPSVNRNQSRDPADDSYRVAAASQISVSDWTLLASADWAEYYGMHVTATDDMFISSVECQAKIDDFILTLSGTASNFAIGQDDGVDATFTNGLIDFTSTGGDGFSLASSHRVNFDNVIFNHASASGPASGYWFSDASLVGDLIIQNSDLSDSSADIFQLNDPAANLDYRVVACKLNSSTALINGSITSIRARAMLISSDDTTGNDLYRMEIEDAFGTITADDANYLDAGDGTNNISWKMVSDTTTEEYLLPLYSEWIEGWIDSTGSKTITVQLTTDNVVLQDDEFWIELEFLGDSGSPLGSLSDSRPATVTTTPSNLTTSTEAWTSPGITTDLDQEVSVTETFNRVGNFRCRLALANSSAARTVWVNPFPKVT